MEPIYIIQQMKSQFQAALASLNNKNRMLCLKPQQVQVIKSNQMHKPI